jgi:hypothetical protein
MDMDTAPRFAATEAFASGSDLSQPADDIGPPGPAPAGGAGEVFQALALACFCLYAIAVLLGVLPVRLLQAEWQIRFGQALVGQAPLALLGLGFAHLAAYLDPDQPQLQARLLALRRWSVVVAVAFLLLVPLQLQAFWSTMRLDFSGYDQQRQRLVERHRELGQAVRSVVSPQELELILERLQGPRLTPAARALPLARLQQELLRSVQGVHTAMERRIRTEQLQLVAARLRSAAALILSAMALGLCFAACAQRRYSPLTLLQEWLVLLMATAGFLAGHHRGRRFVEHDYLEALCAQELADPSALALTSEQAIQPVSSGECCGSAGISPIGFRPEIPESS